MHHSSEKKKHIYQAFGLIFSSELELPEFLPANGPEDVSILLGPVPEKLQDPIETTSVYQLARNEFLLFKTAADYYVKDGKLIIINIHGNATMEKLKSYLTGVVMGALLLQRGLIPIHGSSVAIDGKAVIFTGYSGAGKTTLCSAFRKNQFEYMSDDITVISIRDGGMPLVYPSFPQQRLCKDTAKMMGVNTKNLLLTHTEEKYFINSDSLFRKEPLPLKAIFEINEGKEKTVACTKVIGSYKLKRLIHNIYYSVMLVRMGIDTDLFMKLTKLSNAISYYRIVRPIRRNSTEEQMKSVIQLVAD